MVQGLSVNDIDFICLLIRKDDLLQIKKFLKEKQVNDLRGAEDFVLFEAVANGSFSITKYLVEDCNCYPGYRSNLLNIAAMNHNKKEALLISQYLIETCGQDPYRALFNALTYNNLPLVKYLVETCGCDLLYRGGDPYMNVCIRGHSDIIKYLFERVDSTKMPFEVKKTILTYAASKKHLGIVNIVLQEERNLPDLLKKVDFFKIPEVISEAMKQKNATTIELLLLKLDKIDAECLSMIDLDMLKKINSKLDILSQFKIMSHFQEDPRNDVKAYALEIIERVNSALIWVAKEASKQIDL